MADSGTQYGFGRALVAVYAVFAISATARSIYQLVTKSGEAPLAYGLSALAGLVYILATWALATGNRRIATWAIGFELAGVLGVGLLTTLDPELFPESTVWSNFVPANFLSAATASESGITSAGRFLADAFIRLLIAGMFAPLVFN